MRFRRAVQRYGRTPEPVTPYQRAGQLWDERIGSARVQARNWRLMALGGLALSAGLAGGLLWQSMQSRIVPYVVAVDEHGEPRSVAPAAADYQPNDPQIAWMLGRFITWVRGVSLDPVLMRKRWLSAYHFVTDRGALALNAHARASAPFAAVGKRTVSVTINSIVRASDRSFQVEWTEHRFERGEPAGTERWMAILTLVVAPPTSLETLRKNPLGLYVDAIEWSPQYEVSAAADETTPAAASSSHSPEQPAQRNEL